MTNCGRLQRPYQHVVQRTSSLLSITCGIVVVGLKYSRLNEDWQRSEVLVVFCLWAFCLGCFGARQNMTKRLQIKHNRPNACTLLNQGMRLKTDFKTVEATVTNLPRDVQHVLLYFLALHTELSTSLLVPLLKCSSTRFSAKLV